MDHLSGVFDALCNVLIESVVAGFDAVVDQHEASRNRGAHLRGHAAALALLGPKLHQLAEELGDEVVRRTVPRYEAYLRHPRFSSDALVVEVEDAEKTLNDLLLDQTGSPTASQMLYLWMAILRMRAITIALGAECVAEPIPSRARKQTAPSPRRREITAADIPNEIAAILLNATDGPDQWAEAIAGLAAHRGTALDRGGIATKLSALAECDDGPEYFNRIITRLRSAGYVPDADTRAANDVRNAAYDSMPAPTSSLSARSEPQALNKESRSQGAAAQLIGDTLERSSSGVLPDRTINQAVTNRGSSLARKFAERSRSRGDARQRLADAHARHTGSET
ncbi:hypothetical protein [Stakelama marina]|uniref:Uncharacterized protein n=1 Tax=Stakelama marina TaxID=2826939 RepID=A0A8T4IIM2_9SPHN|nr:hypothetical protein [Stakelama marina]MBR0553734.1 hypothetical protein [Stakelama marina]